MLGFLQGVAGVYCHCNILLFFFFFRTTFFDSVRAKLLLVVYVSLRCRQLTRFNAGD